MRKLKLLLLSLAMILVVGGCGTKETNDDTQDKSDNKTDKKTESSKINDYDTYTLDEAIDQEWFNKIGNVINEESGGTSYTYCNIGFHNPSKKDSGDEVYFTYPDKIILHGKLRKSEETFYVELTKEQYTGELADYIRAFKGQLPMSDESIDKIITDKLYITQEQADEHYQYNLDKYGVEQAEAHLEKLRKGTLVTFNKYMMSPYENLPFDDSTLQIWSRAFARYESEPLTAFNSTIMSDVDYSENYEVLLVYDQMKVNLSLCTKDEEKVAFAKVRFFTELNTEEVTKLVDEGFVEWNDINYEKY